MKYLATMALDLLCWLTFQPPGGHDPDDLADAERDWWQTLIHDLEPDEKDQIAQAAQRAIDSLRQLPPASLSPEAKQKLATLQGLVRGELF